MNHNLVTGLTNASNIDKQDRSCSQKSSRLALASRQPLDRLLNGEETTKNPQVRNALLSLIQSVWNQMSFCEDYSSKATETHSWRQYISVPLAVISNHTEQAA